MIMESKQAICLIYFSFFCYTFHIFKKYFCYFHMIKKLDLHFFIVLGRFKIEFGRTQTGLSEIGILMLKTACIKFW